MDKRLRSLASMMRVRKLREDSRRMELAEASRDERLTADRWDEGEQRLGAIGALRTERLDEGTAVNIDRYLFLSERIAAGQTGQDAVAAEKAATAERTEGAVDALGQAWKDHQAVDRRHERLQRQQSESLQKRTESDAGDIWLARRLWRGS